MMRVISDEDFCAAWQQSESHQEVADCLGLQKSTVTGRGKKLRDLGVALKQFDRQGRSPDYYEKLDQYAWDCLSLDDRKQMLSDIGKENGHHPAEDADETEMETAGAA